MKRLVLPSLVISICLSATACCQAQLFTGLLNVNALYNFNAATPGVGTIVTVTGLSAGEVLSAIDYRPLDQSLIGISYMTATGVAHVYSINPTTGVATNMNANSISLGGGLARITADFNPTANAIRIVTSASTSNNLRLPTGGTGALSTDTDLNPANSGIRATAYSRNVAGGGTSGATTLYEIDGTNNALVTQGSIDFFTGSGTSPNTGTLTTVAALSGITGSSVVGFDILGGGAASAGTAYLATNTTFYSLNLTTGAATTIGSFTGVSLLDVTGVPVPEPSSIALSCTAGFLGLLALYRRYRVAQCEQNLGS